MNTQSKSRNVFQIFNFRTQFLKQYIVTISVFCVFFILICILVIYVTPYSQHSQLTAAKTSLSVLTVIFYAEVSSLTFSSGDAAL